MLRPESGWASVARTSSTSAKANSGRGRTRRRCGPTRILARAVGAPAALAFHVGDVTMRTPLMPGVPWPTTQTGETQIVERDGRILERMTAADGEGFVAATVMLADPEPLDAIPTGLWLRPQPFSIHVVWHLMNRPGRLKYRIDKARGRFPWQSDT